MELVVAIAVGSIVILGAHALLVGMAEHGRRITALAAAADRQGNADRLLRGIVGRIDPDTTALGTFSGSDSIARFTSWCDQPGGWQERCIVELKVQAAGSLLIVLATVEGQDTLTLRDGFSNGVFRYLLSARQGGTWYRAWPAGVTLPLGLGLIIDGDTSILRIGERR
jgi:hypothetical protein